MYAFAKQNLNLREVAAHRQVSRTIKVLGRDGYLQDLTKKPQKHANMQAATGDRARRTNVTKTCAVNIPSQKILGSAHFLTSFLTAATTSLRM